MKFINKLYVSILANAITCNFNQIKYLFSSPMSTMDFYNFKYNLRISETKKQK